MGAPYRRPTRGRTSTFDSVRGSVEVGGRERQKSMTTGEGQPNPARPGRRGSRTRPGTRAAAGTASGRAGPRRPRRARRRRKSRTALNARRRLSSSSSRPPRRVRRTTHGNGKRIAGMAAMTAAFTADLRAMAASRRPPALASLRRASVAIRPARPPGRRGAGTGNGGGLGTRGQGDRRRGDSMPRGHVRLFEHPALYVRRHGHAHW